MNWDCRAVEVNNIFWTMKFPLTRGSRNLEFLAVIALKILFLNDYPLLQAETLPAIPDPVMFKTSLSKLNQYKVKS